MEEVAELLEDLPAKKHGTIRDIVGALGISVGFVHRLIREDNVILPHTNAIKAYLTEQNKLARMMYAMERIVDYNGHKVYKDAYNEVHVDEKWFFISQQSQRIYLSQQEAEMDHDKFDRRCKHKSHIIKVMFLAAVARPRYNGDGECTFDGKIGIWPIVQKVRAKRSSVNRAAGTLETKTLNCDAEVYRSFMINKVLPATRRALAKK